MRKKRTRQHVVADLGVNYVERQVLLSGNTVERVIHDYGYDLILFSYDRDGLTEPGTIGIQVKASETPRTSNDEPIRVRIQRSDLINWLSERRPVLLVMFCVPEDQAYYVDLREYFDDPVFNIFAVGQTTTVTIPSTNMLVPEAISAVVLRKNHIIQGVEQ